MYKHKKIKKLSTSKVF